MSKTEHKSRGFILLLVTCNLLLLLTGCGFKLRGSLVEPLSLPDIYLQSAQRSNLLNNLRTAIQQTKTTVVDSEAHAKLILTITRESKSRRILSVSTAGKVEEYELHYAVSFNVVDNQGQSVLADQSIGLDRAYKFDDSDVLAKDVEAEFLYRDMQRDLVRSMMRRLQAIKIPDSAPETTEQLVPQDEEPIDVMEEEITVEEIVEE